MANKKGAFDKEYRNKRKQLNKLYNELKRLGLSGFEMPKIPKKKTQSSINKLESMMYKYRNKEYKTVSGEKTTLKKQRQRYRDFEKQQGKGGANDIPSIGGIMLDNLKGLINRYPSGYTKALNGLLNSEIKKYGMGAVLETLQNAPVELLTDVQNYIENYDSGNKSQSMNFSRSLKALEHVITGTMTEPLESSIPLPE